VLARLLQDFLSELARATGYRPPNTFVDPFVAKLGVLDRMPEGSFPVAAVERLHAQCLALDAARFFAEPVPEDTPGYHEAIAEPMDLGTIQGQLARGKLRSWAEYYRLVRLVFCNARVYNMPGSRIADAAVQLHEAFQTRFEALVASVDRRNGSPLRAVATSPARRAPRNPARTSASSRPRCSPSRKRPKRSQADTDEKEEEEEEDDDDQEEDLNEDLEESDDSDPSSPVRRMELQRAGAGDRNTRSARRVRK
jgi:hypothetical protein